MVFRDGFCHCSFLLLSYRGADCHKSEKYSSKCRARVQHDAKHFRSGRKRRAEKAQIQISLYVCLIPSADQRHRKTVSIYYRDNELAHRPPVHEMRSPLSETPACPIWTSRVPTVLPTEFSVVLVGGTGFCPSPPLLPTPPPPPRRFSTALQASDHFKRCRRLQYDSRQCHSQTVPDVCSKNTPASTQSVAQSHPHGARVTGVTSPLPSGAACDLLQCQGPVITRFLPADNAALFLHQSNYSGPLLTLILPLIFARH